MQMRNSLFSNNSHTEKRRVWEKLRNKLIAFSDMSLAKRRERSHSDYCTQRTAPNDFKRQSINMHKEKQKPFLTSAANSNNPSP